MDKYIDEITDSLADQAKKKGNQGIYDLNEKLAFQKYEKVARASGIKPLTYEQLKRKRERENSGNSNLFQVDVNQDFSLEGLGI